MPKKTTLLQAIRREVNNTSDYVETRRAIAEVRDALDGVQPDKGLLDSARRAFLRELRFGLMFVGHIALVLLLIVVFNVAAVFLLFWFLSVV